MEDLAVQGGAQMRRLMVASPDAALQSMAASADAAV